MTGTSNRAKSGIQIGGFLMASKLKVISHVLCCFHPTAKQAEKLSFGADGLAFTDLMRPSCWSHPASCNMYIAATGLHVSTIERGDAKR